MYEDGGTDMGAKLSEAKLEKAIFEKACLHVADGSEGPAECTSGSNVLASKCFLVPKPSWRTRRMPNWLVAFRTQSGIKALHRRRH